MTSLLQQAFSAAAQLSEEEQDLLASRLLAELAAEDEFDRKIETTAERLIGLANQALAEHATGTTEELVSEQ